MKYTAFFLAICAFAFWGCEELELKIPELSVGSRRIVVEELTGVRCANCPEGTEKLVELQGTFGAENLIVISIHAAPGFSEPYNNSLEDFQTTEGNALADFIGVFEGAPSAAISRFLPSSATSLFITSKNVWGGIINSEFKKNYQLGLFVINEYDEQTRDLGIKVNIAPDSSLTSDLRLTVVITQDSIVDLQDVKGTVKSYVHRHVLRDVVTNPTGDEIPEEFIKGALITKTFNLKLPEKWVAEHCSVVAYVHHAGTPDKVVLQAAEAHVLE